MKIVYFDEGTATDFLTIKNKGILIEVNQKDSNSKSDISAKGNVGIGPAFSKIINIMFSAEGAVEFNAGKTKEKLVQKSLTNALLSDFLTSVTSNSNQDIIELEGFSVMPEINSIAYYQTISPYMMMTEGQLNIDEGVSLSINKMHSALEFGKGYYEMIATKKDEQDRIFRFNNKAFVNNYSISDLEQMELLFYGYYVGKLDREDLDFQKYMEKKGTNKTFSSVEEMMKDSNINPKLLDVYDIVLAGVKQNVQN